MNSYKYLGVIFSMLFCFPMFGFAQQNPGETVLFRNPTRINVIDNRSKDTIGSVYLNETFLPAKLSDSEKSYLIRFDAYKNEMEIKKDDIVYYIPKAYNFTITFDGINSVYQVFKYEEKGKTIAAFFRVVKAGKKISLLTLEIIKVQKENKAEHGITNYSPPTLKRYKDELYFGFDNFTALPVSYKKNEFFNMFGQHKDRIKQFVSKNKLKIKKQDDLIHLLNFYNNL